jgi:hypothetical protein
MSWFQFNAGADSGTPSPRECHTFECVGSELLMFGGNDGSKRYSDVYALSATTMRWSKLLDADSHPAPEQLLGPSPRSAHTTAIVDGKFVLLFGG